MNWNDAEEIALAVLLIAGCVALLILAERLAP